ncbi:hypothetical protein C8F04DRAFT_1109322 [Mycena alexandri]|uniref:Beta-glucuronidase C-terminal domain-containing protein n=1 Tax=Mycena alexandri TaxID=1745969 RepID=A0AAD6X4I1_9AGAR|nr:hypothetical protein C8F04DRAFT_1109322 [Mycena alexandri]
MGIPLPVRSLGLFLALTAVVPCYGKITVYHANQAAFATASAVPAAQYSGVQAYSPVTLTPPPVPSPAIASTIPVRLQNAGTIGMSIPQPGSFMGFSVEMSVTNQVFGKNSTQLQVPFLNLMANLQQRSGGVRIRVGGNTQELAKLVDSLPNNRILQKNLTGIFGTTDTPPLDYTRDLLYMMANVSALVNVRWFLGVPWFVTKPFDLAIVGASQEILGDYLLGLQCANEPDMYVGHKHRTDPYTPYDYGGEMSDFLTQLAASGLDVTGRAKQLLIGPNIANSQPAWAPEQIWNTGFVDTYSENLAYLAVEKYPTSNCGAVYHDGEAILDPQATFPEFLSHTAHVQLLAPYLNSTRYAQSKGKQFLMMETNSAACGGIGGISDVYGGALWGLDYALQLAHSNFSGGMFHTGGQHVFYNPFIAPPTAQSTFRQWSIGPLYYAALVMAEAMGKSNLTQVLDLKIASPYTPMYALYENGTPVRVAAFNYVDDPTGASDITAVVSVAGGTLPSQLKVKYLAASSVSQKGNYTWAGQTFGGFFESDGRPMGTEDIQSVSCDTTAQTCSVKVPAPGFALIFLTDAVYSESEPDVVLTFATTARTHTQNTVTVDPAVLATSNGHNGAINGLGSTSQGGDKNAGGRIQMPVVLSVLTAGLTMGAALLVR